MEIQESFFEDEVRAGYFVPAMMKRAWASQLEVLEDIDKVCRKYDIPYFADSGTLLGAVRHGGFIPWDDDLDIAMKREDYERFLKIAERELPKDYWIVNIHTQPEFDELFTRVANSRNVRFDREFLDRFHGFPFVSGLDIFPLDYLPAEEGEQELLHSLLNAVIRCAEGVRDHGEEELESQIHMVEELCGVKLDRSRPAQNELFLLAEKLCMMYSEEEAEELTMMVVWLKDRNHKSSKKFHKGQVWLPFEMTQIPVPALYDAALRYQYGAGYMEPVRQWDTHEYPFYEDMANMVRKRIGEVLPRYVVTPEELAEVRQRLEGHLSKKEKPRKERQEVVFLPYKPEMWEGLESVWRAAEADSDWDAYVIPMPYYTQSVDGRFEKRHYEGDRYPDYVPVTRYDAYDFEVHHPDVIVIQNPYDEYGSVTSVEPFFYSRNLKKYTDRLVYIPWFLLDEIEPGDERSIKNMENYVNKPGVVHADTVIVQSENMKQLYIKKLTEFVGEETKDIWEQKILGIGLPVQDLTGSREKNGRKLPKAWKEIVEKPDGSWKKIILYHTDRSILQQNNEQAVNKIAAVLEIFQKNKEEVALLWNPGIREEEALSVMNPQAAKSYQDIVKQYREKGWGIYDAAMEVKEAAGLCDAYYGDACQIAQECKNAGKMIMLQVVDVL